MTIWTECRRLRDGKWRWAVWSDSTLLTAGVTRTKIGSRWAAGWRRRRMEATMYAAATR